MHSLLLCFLFDAVCHFLERLTEYFTSKLLTKTGVKTTTFAPSTTTKRLQTQQRSQRGLLRMRATDSLRAEPARKLPKLMRNDIFDSEFISEMALASLLLL